MTATQWEHWTHALPDGWGHDRFKDVAALRGERTYSESAEEDYLELEDLEPGTGRILNRRHTLDVESAVTKFYAGDVLFGKLRPYLEKFALATFDGKCTGEILAFKPERIDGRFLYYCIASPGFIARCSALSYGAKMPRVNWPTQLAQFNMPLPPPAEQTTIAEFLDGSCAVIDKAIEAKREQLGGLTAMRSTVIHKFVTGAGVASRKSSGIDWAPSIPKRWRTVKLKRHVKLVRGQFSHRPRNDPAFYDGPYPFIQTGSISAADKYVTEYTQTLNEEGLRISKLFPKNTVVMSITGAKIAEVAITTFDACFPDSIIGFFPDHKFDSEYLYYLLIAMRPAVLRATIVTTQPNINYVQLGGNYVPLPPLPEQKKLVLEIEAELAKIRDVQLSLKSQMGLLIAYRK